MQRKSKFTTFILSCIPGLGQIYLGYTVRGMAFMFAAFGIIVLGLFSAFAVRSEAAAAFLLFVLLALWFAAMVDSMILVDKINIKLLSSNQESTSPLPVNSEDIEKQNKKVAAMLLSVIPGVGHLYLGLQKQGIQLITSFFLLFFLTDWVGFSGFLILAPVIWFYSLFDVMHKAAGNREMKDDDLFMLEEIPFIKNSSKTIGFVLVILGIILILNKLVLPHISEYINYQVRNDIKTGIAAALFIIGGIKLIRSNKEIMESKEE